MSNQHYQFTEKTEVMAMPMGSGNEAHTGDELLVFDNSEPDLRVDLAAGIATPPPMKLIARVAILHKVPGITGMDRYGSHDMSYHMGVWRTTDNKEYRVEVRNTNRGIETYAAEYIDEVRKKCRIYGWYVVAKIRRLGNEHE